MLVPVLQKVPRLDSVDPGALPLLAIAGCQLIALPFAVWLGR
ncbi:MAG TPA: hypothetical protein VL738_17765 [Dactylosporangium sp.]|jgi:hypothetical protein|nr:hypothetical protein [Dactylosporangium sp.]